MEQMLDFLHTNFNSHAHVERDRYRQDVGAYALHFNSHAHVERDGITKMLTIRTSISTHTLTWSVTANVESRFSKH